MYDGFSTERLDEQHVLYRGVLPDSLLPDPASFEALWALHPDDYHEVMMHGRVVKTPRWQQAFGRDYSFTHTTNVAVPVPPTLMPFLEWARGLMDARLNGLLLNWYDGTLGHYIGRHRDSTANMVVGTPIVTMSLGEDRTFRLRPWRGSGFLDFPATHGRVFVMPWETNLGWTHEVPLSARHRGRRISVTLRAFQ